MRAWRVHEHGRPTEALRCDEIEPETPGEGQVRVDVSTTVLNYNDVDGCHGRYRTVSPPLPYTLGMEVVGSVDSTGPGLEHWLGRRVMATPEGAYGGYADRAVCRADMTFDAPERLDDVAAAAFYFPFHVAALAMLERGRLSAGESVLIHAAAGGVGSAAVQLASATGAKVFTTSGGPEKVALCRELGADVAIDYLADDFDEVVLEATGGVGVDVVLDTLGGAISERSWRCIARNGRHLLAGFSAGIGAEDAGITPRSVIFGNFDLVGVLLSYSSHWREAKAASGFNVVPREVGERIQAQLVDLLDAGRIRPIVGRVIGFDEIPAGLEDLEARRTTGRTVVRL